MNVNVQPEGMSGIVNDGIAVDSDEKIIMVRNNFYGLKWTDRAAHERLCRPILKRF